jgi:hypothetical protein
VLGQFDDAYERLMLVKGYGEIVHWQSIGGQSLCPNKFLKW